MSKEKCTYRIATTTGSVEVLGEEVKFTGFGEYKFFIHSPCRGWWRVIEFSSGGAVGSGPTRTESLEHTQTQLAFRGKAAFAERIATFRTRHAEYAPFEQVDYDFEGRKNGRTV